MTYIFSPGPVGAVLRCTHPNAICIPNRTEKYKFVVAQFICYHDYTTIKIRNIGRAI